jgi:ABC-type transport system involved in multi-copper enzyme maturation permease subunit
VDIVFHKKGLMSRHNILETEETLERNMWQYLLYFLIGGSIVALVAYFVNQGNQLLAILVGNIPVLFLLNVILAYRAGGSMSSIAYAKGALISLPFFIVFVVIVLLILPRINTPAAILLAMLIYIIPPLVFYRKRRSTFQNSEIPVESFEDEQILTSIAPKPEDGQY